MTTDHRAEQKRTLVLFILGAATILLAAGCAGVPQHLAARPYCPPPLTLLCEPFGPESRCRCADTVAVSRALAGLGVALPADFRR
jgi:hypothetical protein